MCVFVCVYYKSDVEIGRSPCECVIVRGDVRNQKYMILQIDNLTSLELSEGGYLLEDSYSDGLRLLLWHTQNTQNKPLPRPPVLRLRLLLPAMIAASV